MPVPGAGGPASQAAWVPQAATPVVSAATATRGRIFTRHSTCRAGRRLRPLLGRNGHPGPPEDRVAAILMLLHGLPLSRILRLTADDVARGQDGPGAGT